MKINRFAILLLFIPILMQAQHKLFTLDDLVLGGKNYKQFQPKKHKYWWDGKTLVDADESPKPASYPKVESRDHNIFVKLSEEAEEQQITTDGNRQLCYGESVHRNEFGIDGGLFLSPDKKHLAFYRMDQSMVTDYPQVNTKGRIAAYAPDSYPMAGMTSHKVTIGVVKLKAEDEKYSKDDVVWLDLDDVNDRYFTNVSWSPDSKTIFLIELNRDQTDASLDAYDAATGRKLSTLYTEHDDKYVEPQHPITFLPWDEKKFIMWSRKDGFWHLYLGSYDGKQSLGCKEVSAQTASFVQLTKGDWEVMEVLGFCKKTRSVIIATNESNPIQRNLYSVEIETGKRTSLDNGKGWHDGLLNEDGTMLLDSWSEPDMPQAYATVNIATLKTKELSHSDNPREGYAVPIFRYGTIKAADGVTDLHYRMVLPHDFNEAEAVAQQKRYPTILYVYGGPHAHNVDASWQWKSRPWETYMAQKGYIIFILDNRGSENRGKDFEQVTFRQLGQMEMLDQMKGVDYLRTLPYVDMDRFGVHGWSFGGFMTVSLMTNYPDVFKVGVAGGPVIDWKWYEVMYGERYMDTPETNPEGYEKTSLLSKAQNLKGRLLLITGMNDDIVVPQHCLSFLHECNKAYVYPDFYAYPGQGHNMKEHQAVHLQEKITRYFEDYLK